MNPTELLALLKEALEVMREEVSNREVDRLDLACGYCEGAIPVGHSLGCRIASAIYRAEREVPK